MDMRLPVLLLAALLLPWPLSASEGRWAAGLNYPGASIRYSPSRSYCWELRAQSGSGITAAGLRYARYLRASGAAIPFWGLEADFISFKSQFSEGGGLALGALAGLEYYAAPSISVQLDGGPYYISVGDERTGLSAGGVDFVVNMGINFHLGSGGAK